MLFSKHSVGATFVIALSMLGGMLLLPLTSGATEAGPDWLHGEITLSSVSDYNSQDTNLIANIPAESVTAKRNIGSTVFPNLVDETNAVFPTSAGYFSSERALPAGEYRWQNVITTSTQYDALFPNPIVNGLIAMQNAYDFYNASPKGLYYVDDWRTMFGDISVNYQGVVMRKLSGNFNYGNYAKLAHSDGSAISVPTTSGVAYSKNGKWAYVDTNDGQMRVEIPSLQHKVFAPYLNVVYSLSTALSNSGRYIATNTYDQGAFLYDLSTCALTTTCEKRDLRSPITEKYQQTLPGGESITALYINGLKFISESRLEVYATVVTNITGARYVRLELGVGPGLETVRYLALGDSFSSGEGAGDYYEATNFWSDESDYNYCHQSRKAYSEVLNSWLKPDFYDSVACSGAVMKDIYFSTRGDSDYVKNGYPQAISSNENDAYIQHVRQSNLPGYIPQLSLVSQNISNVSTMSIGGNDIGFKDIIVSCIVNLQCYQSRDDKEKLADTVASKIPKLATTFVTVKQNLSGSNPKLYVLGYPKLFAEQTCGNFMNVEEQIFANHLVDYLNESVKLAAARAGVFYVDATNAFVAAQDDHRLCGNSSQAANGVFFDSNNMPNGPFGNALVRAMVPSFHPNVIGHQLLASAIRQQTNGFSAEMPLPHSTSERPADLLYEALVGDADDIYQELGSVSQTITKDIVVEAGQSIDVSYSLGVDDNNLPVEDATITVVVQSVPVTIGTMVVQADGTANGHFSIPPTLQSGVHTVHLIYTDISGQQHDVYQYIYVAASVADFDGDGILNDQEVCVIGGTMGVDRDEDGIDDACDADTTTPVAEPNQNSAPEQEQTPVSAGGARDSSLLKLPNSRRLGDLADTGVYFGSSLEAPKTSSSNTEHDAMNNEAKEEAGQNPDRQMELRSYIILAIMILIGVIGASIYFKKRKRF